MRYGVNTSPGATVRVLVDGKEKVTRNFPTQSDYPFHLHDEEYSNFQTITFELDGKANAWPAPTLKVFEIYPKGNLQGKTGVEVVNKMCDFGTPSVIGAAAANL